MHAACGGRECIGTKGGGRGGGQADRTAFERGDSSPDPNAREVGRTASYLKCSACAKRRQRRSGKAQTPPTLQRSDALCRARTRGGGCAAFHTNSAPSPQRMLASASLMSSLQTHRWAEVLWTPLGLRERGCVEGVAQTADSAFHKARQTQPASILFNKQINYT